MKSLNLPHGLSLFLCVIMGLAVVSAEAATLRHHGDKCANRRYICWTLFPLL